MTTVASRLCIFDLDGTLGHLRGGAAENGNFRAAVLETFPGVDVDTNWDVYPHVSDTGIVDGLYRRHRGRAATPDEHQNVCSAYLRRVRGAVERGETRFELTAGATDVVRTLPDDHGWQIALATGGWKRTATYKLAIGGLELGDRAQAFAEDGPPRETILETALDRARDGNGGSFGRVVYVGDASWDARACAALSWPFVGIGSGGRAERLRALGASHVLPDMSDLPAFLAALDAADVPTSAA